MDQVKEILKQAIKYRFWIAVGVSALLPMIAYFVGSEPVRAAAVQQTGLITSADKGVKPFASGVVPNAQYKGIVGEKTEEIRKDVDQTWKALYERQAPLLTWPSRVQKRFQTWGREWPKDVDASVVQDTIIDYVHAYPVVVSEVYKSFRPFDPEEGTGVVSAPPEAVLLKPSAFTETPPPPLGKVWAAQERLWIQRTLLDVIAQVNKNAKTWDAATIKQINLLEVGTKTAQDQRSIARGDTLDEAPAIDDPNKPAEETPEDAAGAAGMPAGMMGMMGGGAAAASTEGVYYLKSESTQFKVMPVLVSVLIEQDRMQDLLVALENSPMNVQVMDFEWNRPSARVTKPEQGSSGSFGYGGYGGMMGGGMAGYAAGMMKGVTGMGGMYARGGMQGGTASMMQQMMGGGTAGMMGAMGGGPAAPERKGVDRRGENRQKKAEDTLKAAKSAAATSLHDPYYNVVEVKVYGQARFFNPPPAEEPAEASKSEGSSADSEPKAEGDAEKKADEPKAEAAKKADGDAEKNDDATKKADGDAEKKADAPRADEPKAEADAPKKADTPKAAPAAK